MSTELEPVATNPMVLLQTALEKGIDPERLGKLMDLAERWEAGQAAQTFADAITRFQRECSPVRKLQTAGKAGSMQYKFASYDDVMLVCGPVLARCGIAIDFSTGPCERGLKVICRVRVGKHFEDKELEVPIPQMTVNDTQKFGAALSYAKRYVLCAALNIVVTNEDNDAATQYATIDDEQREILSKLIHETRTDIGKFCAWLGAQEIGDIRCADFPKGLAQLQKRKKEMAVKS